jgi:V/A-type H+-transporting ATPase subunit E
MSLSDIKAKIEADARAEAGEILAAARGQVEEIRQGTEEEISRMGEAQKARLEKETPEILRRREIVARLDVNKDDLSARRKLIDEAFEAAKNKMAAMEGESVRKFAEALLSQAIETKEEILLVGKAEKTLDEAWLKAFNEKNGSNLKMAEEKAPIAGGFILRRGLVDVNCSWEMLIRTAREELEAETVKRLFSN